MSRAPGADRTLSRGTRPGTQPAGLRGALALIIACGVLAGGCAQKDSSDLDQYIAEVKARKSADIQPLPEIRVAEVFDYEAEGLTDPFEPFITEQPEPTLAVSGEAGGVRPPANHIREELEQYPLDALRMVGTLRREEEVWGLVTAPDGAVHRVQAGNYMGRNYGKITLVAPDRIELVEITPNGMGGWQERPAELDLAE